MAKNKQITFSFSRWNNIHPPKKVTYLVQSDSVRWGHCCEQSQVIKNASRGHIRALLKARLEQEVTRKKDPMFKDMSSPER